MTKRMMKMGALAVAGGSMMAWLGCLGGNSWWGYVVRDAALAVGYEFVWDNDAVFDLFQDDFGTGTTYDDRNSAEPSRSEPE